MVFLLFIYLVILIFFRMFVLKNIYIIEFNNYELFMNEILFFLIFLKL